MGSIQKRKNKDGSYCYRVQIRKCNIDIQKTFTNPVDAELYILYKERLIENTTNFEVPINKRLRLVDLYEMKIKAAEIQDKKSKNDLENSQTKICSSLPDKFYHEITYEDWLNSAKILMETDVYRGGKGEHNKRKPSITTIRRYFACASSVISYAQSQGLELENNPGKVLQTFINPLMKNIENKSQVVYD